MSLPTFTITPVKQLTSITINAHPLAKSLNERVGIQHFDVLTGEELDDGGSGCGDGGGNLSTSDESLASAVLATLDGTTPVLGSNSNNDEELDPLSMMMGDAQIGDDPLSMMMGGEPKPSSSDPTNLPIPPNRKDKIRGGGNPLGGQSPSIPKQVLSGAGGSPVTLAAHFAMEKFKLGLECPWETHKNVILQEYQITSVKVDSNFLTNETNSGDPTASDSTLKVKSVDRTKARLQALGGEEISEQSKMHEITAADYIKKLTSLNQELKVAWANGERVKSIKIVIKCSNLMANITSGQEALFYPTVFTLVTEVMDTFGEIVFRRIMGKAMGYKEGEHWDPNAKPKPLKKGEKRQPPHPALSYKEINVNAKETCRNWFYKCSSIKSLLPRLYLEIALLKCYRFLVVDNVGGQNGGFSSQSGGAKQSDTQITATVVSEFKNILTRIANMCRGVGDPLVRVYLQCYLARVGDRVLTEITSADPHAYGITDNNPNAPNQNDYVFRLLYDYLQSFQEMKEAKFQKKLKHTLATEFPIYLHLMSPAVGWIIQIAGKHSSKANFTTALKHYRDYCSNTMVLNHMLNSFEPKFYQANAGAMVSLVKSADGYSEESDAFVTQTVSSEKNNSLSVYSTVAFRFLQFPPPQNQRLLLLNEVWKVVTKCKNLKHYILCATKWFEVIILHYTPMELNVLLRDMVRHLEAAPNEEADACGAELDPLVKLLVSHCYDFSAFILTSSEFLLILDKFKARQKAIHCKELLEAFSAHGTSTSDPVLINTLFEVCRTLHDDLDSLSGDGEVRYAGALISTVVGKIEFFERGGGSGEGKDMGGRERQLDTYVEWRGAFCNLDDVKTKLVICVNHLAMSTLFMMNGEHSKKSSSFVKACIAFNHITIPSIDDVFVRLNLLLYCSFVALRNQCLPQTDTFLKQAISLLPEAPPIEELDYKKVGTEPKLHSYLCDFLGLLVVVPGSPEYGPFYLVHGLVKAVPRYAWKAESGLKAKVYISLLGAMSEMSQKKLSYFVEGVDSNDTLYGGSKEYHDELNELIQTIMQTIVEELTSLGEKDEKVNKIQQAEVVVTLVDQMVKVFTLDDTTMKFVKKLLGICEKSKGFFNKELNERYAALKSTVEQTRMAFLEQ